MHIFDAYDVKNFLISNLTITRTLHQVPLYNLLIFITILQPVTGLHQKVVTKLWTYT